MKTEAIKITATNDDDGAPCYAWKFTLLGQDFGGYCRTAPEAFSDACRILELETADLTGGQIDAAYSDLVGYPPIAECGMNLEEARELLCGRMDVEFLENGLTP